MYNYAIIMRKLRHCVKSVQICSYFCSEYWKTRTRNGSVFGHFLRSEGHFNSHQDVISREFYDIFSYVTFPTVNVNKNTWHWGKSGQIRSYFWSVFIPNAGKYGPEITPYLDFSHAVSVTWIILKHPCKNLLPCSHL